MSIRDEEAVLNLLSDLGLDTKATVDTFRRFSEEAIARNFSGENMEQFLAKDQQCYLHLTQDLRLYQGNTGAGTKDLGPLLSWSEEDLLNRLKTMAANSYESAQISSADLISALDEKRMYPSADNLIYPDPVSGNLAMMRKES